MDVEFCFARNIINTLFSPAFVDLNIKKYIHIFFFLRVVKVAKLHLKNKRANTVRASVISRPLDFLLLSIINLQCFITLQLQGEDFESQAVNKSFVLKKGVFACVCVCVCARTHC